jgi:glycerol uptake facilitator protein
MFAQLCGCFVGPCVVWLAYLAQWKETPSQEIKRAVFCTSPAIRSWPSNFLNEVIGTGTSVLCVGAIFDKAVHANFGTGIGPCLVGLLVWAIGLSPGGPTGYAINPARDLGPGLAHAILPISGKGNSDWKYTWASLQGRL